MDPITQGALGAAVTLSWRKPKRAAAFFISGWLGGMAADLDVFIRSANDPIFFLEYHRHFTHSLAFIPIGGLIVTGLLWIFLRRSGAHRFREIYAATTIGYATHGLLDACTSYGTLLFWPFSTARVAWNSIAIVDFFFTGFLLLGLTLTLLKKQQVWVRIGLILALTYLGFGFVMRDLANEAAAKLAAQRGHTPQRVEAKPTLFNLVLWRSVYEFDGRFHVDAVWLTPWNHPKIYPGTSVAKVSSLPESWPTGSVLASDFERFKWFSNDCLAWHPIDEGVLGDLRYSTIPNRVAPLWGIRASAGGPNHHVDYVVARRIEKGDWTTYWNMMFGR